MCEVVTAGQIERGRHGTWRRGGLHELVNRGGEGHPDLDTSPQDSARSVVGADGHGAVVELELELHVVDRPGGLWRGIARIDARARDEADEGVDTRTLNDARHRRAAGLLIEESDALHLA